MSDMQDLQLSGSSHLSHAQSITIRKSPNVALIPIVVSNNGISCKQSNRNAELQQLKVFEHNAQIVPMLK
jgi:hypothetical protein